MRKYLILLSVVIGLLPAGSAFAQPMEIEAMLILASNDPAPLDRRLERVDYLLRPLLRFETYRLMGQGSVMVPTPGETTIALGDGHFLRLKTGKHRGAHVEVVWSRGDTRLMSTAVKLDRNKPTILGGIPHDSGRLIVVISVK